MRHKDVHMMTIMKIMKGRGRREVVRDVVREKRRKEGGRAGRRNGGRGGGREGGRPEAIKSNGKI